MRLTPTTLALAVSLIACSPSGKKPDQQSHVQKTCANIAKHVRRDCKRTGATGRTPRACEELADDAEIFCTKTYEEPNKETIEVICRALGDSVRQNCDRKGKKSRRKCEAKGKKKEKKCRETLGAENTESQN